jgi:hypothetical protein
MGRQKNNKKYKEAVKRVLDPSLASLEIVRIVEEFGMWEKEMCCAVARNPNTPSELLKGYLLEQYAEEIVQNPAFPLFRLEDPNFGFDDEDWPSNVVIWLQRKQPKALVEPLEKHKDAEVRKAALMHISKGKASLEEAHQAFSEAITRFARPTEDEWLEAAEAGLAPRYMQEKLLVSWDGRIRRDAAKLAGTKRLAKLVARAAQKPLNTKISPESLTKLASLGNYGAFLAARHPNTPLTVLRDLAQQTHIRIRYALARNPSTPHDVIVILQTDTRPRVQYALDLRAGKSFYGCPSRRPVLSEEEREEKRFKEKQIAQLIAQAKDPNTHPTFLGKLTRHDDEHVVFAAIKNPNTPQKALDLLMRRASEPTQTIKRREHWTHAKWTPLLHHLIACPHVPKHLKDDVFPIARCYFLPKLVPYLSEEQRETYVEIGDGNNAGMRRALYNYGGESPPLRKQHLKAMKYHGPLRYTYFNRHICFLRCHHAKPPSKRSYWCWAEDEEEWTMRFVQCLHPKITAEFLEYQLEIEGNRYVRAATEARLKEIAEITGI